ncbi:hypothetical protein Slin15195_G012220 [Septoria linicola]|uniref:Uncharacterized protein n=1 Tax=Septoria linicola TaxID=215465 RepID=A0A9Q9AJ59_9PEZI|nr:hypothetical protein Slin14017_G012240 [Septoria linicola]USW47903.1 hypothetical protein Slin15195_G012220 [Septoria linicola]
MSSTRNFPKTKVLPVDQPNAGEKLIVNNFATDGSGRYSWSYAPLTKRNIFDLGGNPNDRAIEIRVKNFDVSKLFAVMQNFPNNKNPLKFLIVVELDERYTGATKHAVELIKTVGIPDDKVVPGAGFRLEGPLEIRATKDNVQQEVTRKALFGGLSVEFDESKVNAQQVLQFWEDIGAARERYWSSAEVERWIHFKWEVVSKAERKTGTAATVAIWVGVAAVAVAGTLWASNQI